MKLFIGPMSKNVVDSIISYGAPIGIIPSRRQVDYNGGYVNNWNTRNFVAYVREKTGKCSIERDHGGPNQGAADDDGFASFAYDSILKFDIVHIDVWKKNKDFKSGLADTIKYIKFCYNLNPNLLFEVGTEAAIRNTTANELYDLLNELKQSLTTKEFDNIKYVVIQSGTSLKNGINTGSYDPNILKDMINVCVRFNKLSKEHNGDYLLAESIHDRFDKGLDAINIAPEFGGIESEVLCKYVDEDTLNMVYLTCIGSNKWQKWVSDQFDISDKKELVKLCGHYIFADPNVKAITSDKLFIRDVEKKIHQRIDSILKR